MSFDLQGIVNWSRPAKFLLLALTDFLVIVASFYVSVAVDFTQLWPSAELYASVPFLVLALVIFPLVFTGFHLYHHMVRYAGSVILFEAVKSVTVAVVVTIALSAGLLPQGLPPVAVVAFWVYALLGTASSRLLAKWLIASIPGADAPVHRKLAIYNTAGDALERYKVSTKNASTELAFLNSPVEKIVILLAPFVISCYRNAFSWQRLCLMIGTHGLLTVIARQMVIRTAKPGNSTQYMYS